MRCKHRASRPPTAGRHCEVPAAIEPWAGKRLRSPEKPAFLGHPPPAANTVSVCDGEGYSIEAHQRRILSEVAEARQLVHLKRKYLLEPHSSSRCKSGVAIEGRNTAPRRSLSGPCSPRRRSVDFCSLKSRMMRDSLCPLVGISTESASEPLARSVENVSRRKIARFVRQSRRASAGLCSRVASTSVKSVNA